MAERVASNTATTTTNQLHALRTGGHGAVQSSSPRTPCPVCSRTKDSDCRWSLDAGWIACHSGAAAPAAPSAPGGLITIDGAPWALIRINAGHSGGAHLYRPHRPGERSSSAGGRHARLTAGFQNEADLELIARARLLQTHLRPQVHALLRLPPWDQCGLAEMRAVIATHQQVCSLVLLLQQASRLDPSIRRLLPCATHWRKQCGYAVADLHAFEAAHLGMAPTYLDGVGVVEVAS